MTYKEAKPHLKQGMRIKALTSECHLTKERIYTYDGINTFKQNGKHSCTFVDFNWQRFELEILTNSDGTPWVHPDQQMNCGCAFCYDDSFIFNEQATINNIISTYREQYINEPKAQKKGIIMNAIDKLKNLALSKEDRILRDEGLEDSNGKITEEAKQLMAEEMRDERWATRRLEIAKDLLKIKSEEKK